MRVGLANYPQNGGRDRWGREVGPFRLNFSSCRGPAGEDEVTNINMAVNTKDETTVNNLCSKKYQSKVNICLCLLVTPFSFVSFSKRGI